MRQDSYTDKTGAQRTSYELNCDNVSFVGNKSDNQSAGGYAPAPAAPSNMGSQRPVSDPVPSYSAGSNDDFAVIDDTEDLPF